MLPSQPTPAKSTRTEGSPAIAAPPQPIDVSDEEESDEHFFFQNGFFYCTFCFNKDTSPKTTLRHTGRGGTGVHGRYAQRSPAELRAAHAREHKTQQESPHAAAQRLFNQAPPNEVWAWALVDGNLSFSALSRPSLVAAFASLMPGRLPPKTPSPHELSAAVAALAAHLRVTLRERYAGMSCVLADDGGTLHRRPLLNLMVRPCRPGARTFFVSSRQVLDGTAATIAENVALVKTYVREKFGMIPIAIVSDNASAMAKGCAAEEDEEDDEAAELFETEPAEEEEEAEQVGAGEPFFLHICCWAHCLQLVIGDIARALPLATALLQRIGRLPRSLRQRVAAARAARGEATQRLIVPTATRWNSSTRAAARIIEFIPDLQNEGVGFEEPELRQLRLFVAVSAPLCWATTALQADAADLTATAGWLAKVRSEWNSAKDAAQNFPEQVRDTMLAVLSSAFAALLAREKKYLRNEALSALETLSATKPVEQDAARELGQLVLRFFKTTGCSFEGKIEEELEDFLFRQDEDRARSAEPAYWEECRSRFPLLARFRREVGTLLATEACVERSFQRQGDIWTARRNKLAATAMDDQMFIALNYVSLRTKVHEEEEKRKHKVDVTKDVVNKILSDLEEVRPRTPRPQRIRVNVRDLGLGKRVEVKFKIAKQQEKWFAGTIVKIVNDEKREFEVCWDEFLNPTERITLFRPLSFDHDWRFC